MRSGAPLPRLLAGGRTRTLAGLVMNGVGQAIATLCCAWLMHRFFDGVMVGAGVGTPEALSLVAGLLGGGAVLAGLRAFERVQAERMGQSYAAELRLALFDSMANRSPRQLQGRSRGATVLRFIGDVKGIRRWISLGLPRIAVGLLSATLALGALALVSPLMALGAGLGFAGAAGALSWLGSRVETAVRAARRQQARLAANVNDKIAGIAVVQVFDQVGRERRLLERQGAELAEAMVQQTRGLSLLRSAAEFSGAFASAAVLVAGALEVARGSLSASEVVGAVTVVGLLAPVFREFGQAIGYWRTATVAFEKLATFIAGPRLDGVPNADTRAPAAAGVVPGAKDGGALAIEFEQVSCGTALRDFSAFAPAGKTVAIVGPSGAGKSTVLALAARLMEPESGAVRLGGRDVRDYGLATLRRALGVVMPDLPLLRGTIERNLRYRWPDAPDLEVARIAQQCGVDELLRELPDGARTRLSDGGGNLSYGQRQRIAWVRALLGSPMLLLLDEADTNLDPPSARRLSRIVEEYRGTVLMVTHDLATMMRADLVWYVEAGRLLESGSPQALMARNGRTRRLFRREADHAG